MEQVLSNQLEIAQSPELSRSNTRQVDWRYLLPYPRFISVALVEPVQDSLVDALAPFSEEYRRIDPLESNGLVNSFDLLVLQGPSPSTINHVKKYLKPGGLLYLEASNWLAKLIGRELMDGNVSPSKFGFHSAASYIKALQIAGYSKIEVYWVWPDFINSTKYIALDGSGTLIYALNQNKGGFLSRLKSVLAKIAVKSRGILYLVPNFCIVAQRVKA